MFAIIKLPITDPSGPALATPVAVSETELTIELDRPSTGPTQIAFYTLERSLVDAGSFSVVAQGLDIFPVSDTGLTAETSYTYRANATDTTGRTSAWGYATGTTDASATVDPADYTIAAGTSSSTFEGNVVSPGEIVEFAAGTHGPRTIQNLAGTALNPIIVRSAEDGQAIIRRTTGSSGGFVLSFRNCQYVEVDGSYTTGQTYGLKVMNASSGTDSPSAFVQFWDNSTGLAAETPFENITIRYVDVDGGWSGALNTQRSIGIQFNDSAFLASAFPGVLRNGLVVEYCRIRNCEGEGIYMGPNFSQGHLPIQNCHIRYSVIDNTGWDGAQMKMSVAGTNTIHHNTVTDVGQRADTQYYQHYGIAIDSGQGDIYANYIADTGHHGIQIFTNGGPSTGGPFVCDIYNNVVVRAGTYHVAGDDTDGIVVGASTSTVVKVEPAIYNNTIISPDTRAIDVNTNTATGTVRNNLVISSTGINVPGGVTATNNPTSASFVNAGADDYHLTAAVAAVGTIGTDIAATDFDGDPRTAGAADCGAFEYP